MYAAWTTGNKLINIQSAGDQKCDLKRIAPVAGLLNFIDLRIYTAHTSI